MSDEEFFVGWQADTPKAISRFLRRRSILVLALAVFLAVTMAALQGTIGVAHVSTEVPEFRGVLVSAPVPTLIGDAADSVSGARFYYLVNPTKFGFDPDVADEHNLMHVSLRGTLIYREDGQAMIEVAPGSVEVVGQRADANPLGAPVPLGEMTLEGEIVDSKCYLGIMNPGVLKPHRACAMLCIKGGIPPILLVRDESGASNSFLLVDENGGAVNEWVMDYVALPISVTGQAERVGDRLVLKAPLSNYTLLE